MSEKRQRLAALALVLAGAAMIAIGGGRGEVNTGFRKAINICLECIGIG